MTEPISNPVTASAAGARIKRVLPALIVDAVRDCQGLPSYTVAAYVRLRLARALRIRSDRPKLRGSPHSLLFVCHGNIMRSPVAAELFRARMPSGASFGIESGGTWTRDGRVADPRAVAAAARLGISLQAHRSRVITPAMVKRADLICVMDYRNEAEIVSRYPNAAVKTILLGGVAESPDGPSIPDPYMLDTDAVAAIYARLSAAVDALVHGLATS